MIHRHPASPGRGDPGSEDGLAPAHFQGHKIDPRGGQQGPDAQSRPGDAHGALAQVGHRALHPVGQGEKPPMASSTTPRQLEGEAGGDGQEGLGIAAVKFRCFPAESTARTTTTPPPRPGAMAHRLGASAMGRPVPTSNPLARSNPPHQRADDAMRPPPGRGAGQISA